MSDSPITPVHKRALVVAYYLSRFDRKGVKALGYQSFTQAFDAIGETLGVKSATVKHMRDSFDPYCSPVRVGWYQRKILPSRANVIQAYNDLSEGAMAQIVREILTGDSANYDLYTTPVVAIDDTKSDLLNEDNPFANRLRTGEKAEAFFMEQYPAIARFAGSTLDDTRKLGIGFDFRVAFSGFYNAVEVKGVIGSSGYISFTDKEWSVAQMLETQYILALVRSLDTTPTLELIPDPARELIVTMRTAKSISVCWNAKV